MNSSESLKYTDEVDKSFGLAGMAISLMAWDAEEMLERIDLDSEDSDAMLMSTDYYFCTSPKVGAKAVWEQTLKRFQITVAITVGNLVCRELTHRNQRKISANTDSELRKILLAEGAALCDLEEDEVNQVYNKSLSYCNRLFGHSGVCQLTKQLAETIRTKRAIEAAHIWEILAPLNNL